MITLKLAPLSFGTSIIERGESWTVFVLYIGYSLVLISARVFLYSWYICSMFITVYIYKCSINVSYASAGKFWKCSDLYHGFSVRLIT